MPTFDATDLDNAASESGVVHENTANTDHTNASQLKQGFDIANPYLSADLAGYWPFQEDSGSMAYDYSGNNYDGTYNGATLNATGLLGTSAISCDGSGDWVETSMPTSVINDFVATFSCWIKYPTGGSDYPSIFGKRNYGDSRAPRVGIQSDDTLRAVWQDAADTEEHITSVQSSNSYADGKWHHFVVVFDRPGDRTEMFVDGASVATDTWSSTTPKTISGDIPIGVLTNSSNNTVGDYYDGDISDVRIYDRPLSASEIQTLYDVVATRGTLTTQFKTV